MDLSIFWTHLQLQNEPPLFQKPYPNNQAHHHNYDNHTNYRSSYYNKEKDKNLGTRDAPSAYSLPSVWQFSQRQYGGSAIATPPPVGLHYHTEGKAAGYCRWCVAYIATYTKLRNRRYTSSTNTQIRIQSKNNETLTTSTSTT